MSSAKVVAIFSRPQWDIVYQFMPSSIVPGDLMRQVHFWACVSAVIAHNLCSVNYAGPLTAPIWMKELLLREGKGHLCGRCFIGKNHPNVHSGFVGPFSIISGHIRTAWYAIRQDVTYVTPSLIGGHQGNHHMEQSYTISCVLILWVFIFVWALPVYLGNESFKN